MRCPRCNAESLVVNGAASCACVLNNRTASLESQLAAAERERDEARGKLSELALKRGGENAGHAYGPTNCAACGTLSNDYYLVGKSQLCVNCFESFPALAVERDRLREANDEMYGLLRTIAVRDDSDELSKRQARELLEALADAGRGREEG